MRLTRRIDARRPTARAASAHRAELLKAGFLTGIVLLASAVWSNRAQADADLDFDPARSTVTPDGHYLRFSTALPGTRDASGAHRTELRDQDLSSFSGVGMIVCTSDGVSRSSTAFLVGAFDIAVTVAHTFQSSGDAQPHCVYNSVDSLGQIRERIPVAYIKSQWEVEAGASGELSKDLAVVRLTQPSRYAQRTMPLGRFTGSASSVVMVGFKEAGSSDTFKLKKRGRVYDEAAGIAQPTFGAFTHDMDSLNVAAGAPVIDEQTGVIIGIHTKVEEKKNTMITMNDWLEATIKGELQDARAN
jgi:hypothetical protein